MRSVPELLHFCIWDIPQMSLSVSKIAWQIAGNSLASLLTKVVDSADNE